MKKELMILLMITSSVMILSAAGKQDDTDEQYYGRGAQGGGMMRYNDRDGADREEFFEERQARMEEYLEDLEVVTVNGALTLVNGELPYIESNGVKYSFMAPWVQIQDLELENGMKVSVEGYEMPGRPLQWDGAEKSIMVTKAVINGEEIVIEHEPGMYGRGGFKGSGRHGGARQGGMMGQS